MALLISFSGLPGVGKSTVARALAAKIGSTYIRVDSIETALKNSSLRIHLAEDAGYLAAVAIAKDNLQMGLGVVADTVNPIELTRSLWADAAAACRARLIDVQVICSDEAEHRRRVETRHTDEQGLALPDWEQVKTRVYDEWSGPRIVLDTAALSVNDCVDRIIAASAPA